MPTPTYTPLATVTLGTTAASVTFSSIPATYRDLILIANPTTNVNGAYPLIRANSDSGSNYFRVWMRGLGASLDSAPTSNMTSFDIGNVLSSTPATFVLQFMDYSATDKHKTLLLRADTTYVGTDGATMAAAQRYASTSAITSLQFTLSAGLYASGSTFSLYGVIA
jgi:hypothetical protein